MGELAGRSDVSVEFLDVGAQIGNVLRHAGEDGVAIHTEMQGLLGIKNMWEEVSWILYVRCSKLANQERQTCVSRCAN